MCSDRRCPWRVGKNPCPWEIGNHPASIADARDQMIASQAIGVTGLIPLADAERMYAAWRKRAGLRASSSPPEGLTP
jgi:hypothetical protein